MLWLIIISVVLIAGWLLGRMISLKPSAPYTPDTYSGFVDVKDARVHYSKHGPDGNTAPALVLIHGLGAYSFIWRFVIPVWSKHFTVIAIDLPGFGRSSKARKVTYGLDEQSARAAEALTKLGIDKATLVGSSMGGAVVLWMAHLWPERFPKVAALAPATNPRLVPPWMGVYQFLSPLLRFAINKRTLRPFVINAVGRPEIVTSEALDAYIEPFRDRDAIAALMKATMQLLRDPRLPGDLRDIKSEVLLLYGEKDRVIPRAMMDELRGVLPRVTFKTNPSAGHHPMEDEPTWIAREVEDFAAPNTP